MKTNGWPLIEFLVNIGLLVYTCNMTIMADQMITERMYLHTALGISCLKCPPGTYRIAHCTKDDHQAKCTSCEEGSFQTDYTVAESCEPCLELCRTDREYMVNNCSARTNNICVCKPGFHRLKAPNNLCIKHDTCPPGQGVAKIGTPDSDTECENCKDEYFSPNESLTQICQPCSKCPPGYKSNRLCPKDSDTKCVPEHENDTLPIILGVVGGIVFFILVVIILVICIRARRGHGPKLLVKLCPQRNDSESIPEKTPLSSMEKNSNNHNGMTNGDVVDKPENQNGFSTEDPPGVVPNEILLRLSHDLICPQWAFFFRHLIGPSADNWIDESIIDNKGVREQIYKLLLKWKHMRKDKATLDEIVSALKDSDHADLASKYSRRRSTDV